ncbi:MAG TPA: hypothetical protein VGE93_11220, partial [Bryobacteraceae bacterium]
TDKSKEQLINPGETWKRRYRKQCLPLGRLVASSYGCSLRMAPGSGQMGVAVELNSKSIATP